MPPNILPTSAFLPLGWASAPLDLTGRYINGLAFRPEDWGNEGRPIIRIQNLTDPDKPFNRSLGSFPDDFIVAPGDMLVSWSATLDAFIWHREEAILNQHIFKVVPNEGLVSPRFLFYLLRHSIEKMKKTEHLHGSTMKHINRGPFLSFQVPVPPLPEQHRIVAEIERQFSLLDAGVANLKRVQANLKRYRAAVLQAACTGQLVPTEADTAQAEGRPYEPADVLLTRILAERRARWEAEQLAKMEAQGKLPLNGAWKAKYQEPAATDTSGLPELPEGWVWTPSGQLAEVGTGATPLRNRAYYYEGGSIPWVTSGALNYVFVDQAEECITERAVKETNAKVFPPGTLLVAMYGEGKTRGKTSELRIAAATNQACAALTLSGLAAECKPYMKLFLLKNYEDIRRLSSGGVQPNLNLSIIKGTAVPLPPLAEQERIVAEVERRLSVVDNLEQVVKANLKRAERLRQAVLKEAFAGRLVPQDPADEPASALLGRIKAEREATQKEKKTPTVRAKAGTWNGVERMANGDIGAVSFEKDGQGAIAL